MAFDNTEGILGFRENLFENSLLQKLPRPVTNIYWLVQMREWKMNSHVAFYSPQWFLWKRLTLNGQIYNWLHIWSYENSIQGIFAFLLNKNGFLFTSVEWKFPSAACSILHFYTTTSPFFVLQYDAHSTQSGTWLTKQVYQQRAGSDSGERKVHCVRWRSRGRENKSYVLEPSHSIGMIFSAWKLC